MASKIKPVGSDVDMKMSLIENGEDLSGKSNQVKAKPNKRKYTAKQKLKVISDVATLADGEVEAYLRKHGLYSSHLFRWRQQAENGLLGERPGRKVERDYQAERFKKLEKENQRLQEKLRQAEIIIDVQKKLAEMLGVEMPEIAKKYKSK